MNKTITCALALASGAFGTAADATPPSTNFNVEHISYSAGRGSRTVATADAVAAMAEDTKFILSLSEGERRGGGDRTRATRVGGTLARNWTSRLSSQTSVAVATNSRVFARQQFTQDISYKLGDSIVATVGGKYAAYAGDHVTSWSAGASYYLPGFSASYRFSLLDSGQLGWSHAHLLNLSVKDPGGKGSTQLWLGRGNSLYELLSNPRPAAGKFTSVALRRVQPVGKGLALNVGVNRTWYDTPAARYHGTGVTFGLSVAKWPF